MDLTAIRGTTTLFNSTVQYSTVQYSTVQYSTVQYRLITPISRGRNLNYIRDGKPSDLTGCRPPVRSGGFCFVLLFLNGTWRRFLPALQGASFARLDSEQELRP